MVDVTPSPDPDKNPPRHLVPVSQEIHSSRTLFANLTPERPASVPAQLRSLLLKLNPPHFEHLKIGQSGRELINSLGIIESETAPPDHRHLTGTPFFQRDQEVHASLWKCMQRLELRQIESTNPSVTQSLEFAELADEVDLANAPSSDELASERQKGLLKLQQRNQTLIYTAQEDHIRLSPGGLAFSNLLNRVSTEIGELSVNILLKIQTLYYANVSFIPQSWVRHIENLSCEEQPERHLRKLYLAVVDGSVHDDSSMEKFAQAAHFDQKIVSYLGGSPSEQTEAASYLQSRDGGRYGPPPFRYSQPEYRQTLEESRAMVIRARGEAGAFHYLTHETRRLPDNADSLYLRFGRESFSQVQGLYTSDQNIPPGGGFVFRYPIPEKLFFSTRHAENFVHVNQDWLGPALEHLDNTVFAALRGAKIYTNDHPDFHIGKIHYAYVVFNDHQNSSYIAAMLLPTRLIADTLKSSVFEFKTGPRENTPSTSDRNFTAHALYSKAFSESEARYAALPPDKRNFAPTLPIDISGISALFSGAAFGMPPRSTPYFSWENQHLSAYWHDVAGHIHSSYRIWGFRSDREQVDRTLLPLQQINREVADVALRYQRLSGLIHNRYNAWKSDHTPGPKQAPRMLVECYRQHHFFADQDRAPVLALVHRDRSQSGPIPILDCKTMELFVDGQTIQMPRRSDGRESLEINLWNLHVRPNTTNIFRSNFAPGLRAASEGNFELCLMGREYLNR